MPSLTLSDLQRIAQHAGTVELHHGTDVASANDIQQNGLQAGKARALGGAEFWSTDDPSVAELFARVNPAGGQPAVLTFRLSASLIVQLLAASPPSAELDEGLGIAFHPASFAAINADWQIVGVVSLA